MTIAVDNGGHAQRSRRRWTAAKKEAATDEAFDEHDTDMSFAAKIRARTRGGKKLVNSLQAIGIYGVPRDAELERYLDRQEATMHRLMKELGDRFYAIPPEDPDEDLDFETEEQLLERVRIKREKKERRERKAREAELEKAKHKVAGAQAQGEMGKAKDDGADQAQLQAQALEAHYQAS